MLRWVRGEEIKMQEVEYVQSQLKVKFPQSYVDIILHYDQSRPEVKNPEGLWVDGIVDTAAIGSTGMELLSFKNKGESSKIIDRHQAVSWEVTAYDTDSVIPFAQNGAGDHLLFDYRSNRNEPQIVFLYHEDGSEQLELIAESFDAFLDLIYPDDE